MKNQLKKTIIPILDSKFCQIVIIIISSTALLQNKFLNQGVSFFLWLIACFFFNWCILNLKSHKSENRTFAPLFTDNSLIPFENLKYC